MPTYYCALPDRGILQVQGEDVAGFLQGLVSNDVHNLQDGGALYAALLTPQGKYLHDFLIYRQGNTYLLDCEAARRDDLRKRLTMYKLRRPITIEDVTDNYTIFALWGDKPASSQPKDGLLVDDPRHPGLGQRRLAPVALLAQEAEVRELQAAVKTDFLEYDRLRISLCIPDGSRDMPPEGTFLLENGFEALHGVSFSKGCYVGQEVTARSKHRGSVKKSLAVIRSTNGSALPASGTPITTGDTTLGELRSSCGDLGLALVRFAQVQAATQKTSAITAGNTAVTVTLPLWIA